MAGTAKVGIVRKECGVNPSGCKIAMHDAACFSSPRTLVGSVWGCVICPSRSAVVRDSNQSVRLALLRWRRNNTLMPIHSEGAAAQQSLGIVYSGVVKGSQIRNTSGKRQIQTRPSDQKTTLRIPTFTNSTVARMQVHRGLTDVKLNVDGLDWLQRLWLEYAAKLAAPGLAI